MPHRSVLPCMLGTFVALLLVVTPAQAALVPVPADAPTVATAPSGAAVIAWMAGAKLCVVVQRAGAARPATLDTKPSTSESAPGGACRTAPVLAQFAAEALGADPPNGARFTMWGVAGPSVARLELRTRSGVVATSPATMAPLPGAAADLRFWALDIADARPVDEVALLDDAGVVRRALDPAQDLRFWTAGEALPPQRVVVLQGGRQGRTTWRLSRTVRTGLAPTPLEPERREDQHCLTLAVKTGTSAPGANGPCEGSALRHSSLSAWSGGRCGLGAYVAVLTRAPVRSVYAVLGDGTRRTVPLRRFGGRYASGRGGVLIAGDDTAIRQVVALGAGRRAVARTDLRQAPVPPAPCSGEPSGWTTFDEEGLFAPEERLGGSPHAPHAVDQGAELCVAIDRAPRFPADCALPPVDPRSASLVTFQAPGGRRYLYGIVAAEITQARLTLDDRSVRTVPATPIAGYAGRYAAALRQVSVDVPAGRRATRVALLDARGRVLADGIADAPDARVGRSVTLAPATMGIGPLRATKLEGFDLPATCITVRLLTSAFDCDVFAEATDEGGSTVELIASCAPRRLVVLAVLPRRDDRLVLSLRGGRTVVARKVRIPRGAGAAAGRAAAFAVLGPDARLDAVHIRGRVSRSVAVRLPAVAGQCGYTRDLYASADEIYAI